MSEKFRPDPREAFPEEVIQAHDEYGIPWPAFLAAPIYTGTSETEAEALRKLADTSETEAEALRKLAEVRQEAAKASDELEDEPSVH